VEVQQLKTATTNNWAGVGKAADQCVDAILRQRLAPADAGREITPSQREHGLVSFATPAESIDHIEPGVHWRLRDHGHPTLPGDVNVCNAS
jgi:hypothetical protein